MCAVAGDIPIVSPDLDDRGRLSVNKKARNKEINTKHFHLYISPSVCVVVLVVLFFIFPFTLSKKNQTVDGLSYFFLIFNSLYM